MATALDTQFIFAWKSATFPTWTKKIFLAYLFLICGFLFLPSNASAQSWALKDIGSPGATGTYSTGSGPPPTYTIGGAGTGISASSDSFAFVNVATSGNIELQGKVTTLGSTSASSFGGLAIRDSFTANNATQVAIYVTSSNGVKFSYRVRGNNVTTVNGSASTAPVYLRLTKNGDTYSGYESADGTSWTLVGSYTAANILPQLYFAGFASSSTVSGTLNSVTVSNFSYMTSVPQQEPNLIAWYRSDVGITQSSGAISSWSDQSGNSNDATQSTGSQKPTLVSGAINNSILPSVSFDGTDDRFSLPTDFSDLTAGGSLFIVLKPTSSSGTRTPITVGNASNADSLTVQTNNTNSTLVAYNNTTSSSVSTSNNPITVNSYQVLEQTFEAGSNGTGTIFVNGVQKAQATNLVSTLRNVSRSSNFIGMSSATADFFQGEIAEILFFKTTVSASSRASIESYFVSKFGVGNTPTLDAPVFSPGSGVFAPFQSVNLSQSQGATIYYSLDGSTPNTSVNYPWYGGESLKIPETSTLNAIAVKPFFNNSSASAIYQIDPNTVGIPRSGLLLWLMANDGVVLASGNVSQWTDKSGNGNNLVQSNASNRPGYSTSAINELPAVSFNGSSQYLSIPSGFSNFASGASIFLVVKPSAVSAGARIIDLGNGATSDNINIQEPTNTGASLYVYSGSTPSSVTSSSAITLGQFQLLEAVHDGSTTATIFTNALQGAQSTSMNSITSILRASNYLGQGSAGGNYFNGSIAEVLVYNRAISSLEKSAIEAALINKYQAFTAVSSPPPIISVPTGTLPGPTQVAISSQAGAITYFTVDGSTPTTSSTIYTGPLNIYFTQTVKAMSVLKGVQSSVSSAFYTLNSTDWPAPDAGDPTQLDIQLKLPATAIP